MAVTNLPQSSQGPYLLYGGPLDGLTISVRDLNEDGDYTVGIRLGTYRCSHSDSPLTHWVVPDRKSLSERLVTYCKNGDRMIYLKTEKFDGC